MAETEPLPRKTHHPDPNPNPNPNPTKYFTRFLYKSAFVLIFLVIIPLFPSQAPEFIHQSFPTRSWELLHLIFVGIAVSYGLFSRKNDDVSDKDTVNNNNPSMFDHAQSYISRIFHVSPPFDEETDAPLDENKVVQTWSSQYTRNDPVVMVAKESEGSEIREKPLLLPIRSLKSRVFEGEEEKEHGDEQPRTVSASFTRSSSMNKKINDLQEKKEKEEKPKDDLVLPSPIPWRSRSGRLELKEEVQEPRLSRSQTLEPKVSGRLSPPNSVFLEPKKPRIIGEDFVRKKSFRKSNPAPPPPPPPPPPMPPRVPPAISKSSSMRPSRASVDRDVRRVRSGFEPGNPYEDDLPRKSVRTVRSGSGKARVEDEPMNFEFVEVPKEEENKYDFVKEELVSESDEDSSEEDNHNDGDASNDGGGGSGIGDGGPDVDKKADEFIAKFREQIRLQRIESIKRSSAEISKRVHR